MFTFAVGDKVPLRAVVTGATTISSPFVEVVEVSSSPTLTENVIDTVNLVVSRIVAPEPKTYIGSYEVPALPEGQILYLDYYATVSPASAPTIIKQETIQVSALRTAAKDIKPRFVE